jgi:hypothetical protein
MARQKIEKNYNTIRNALIALLCVGDTIKLLHHISGLGLTITKHHITEISEREIKLESYHYSPYKLYSVEYYQGELYIYTEDEEKFNYRSESRIIRMWRLIENVETIAFEYIG